MTARPTSTGLRRVATINRPIRGDSADAAGNVPAVAFARATLARGIIRDRARAGLSQAELARRAGIRPETVCRIERGRHTPSVATIQRIDRAIRKALAGR